MNAQTSLFVLMLGVLLSAKCTLCAGDAPPELLNMKAIYQKSVTAINDKYEAELAHWPDEYKKELQPLAGKFQAAGSLEGWSDVKAELERISESADFPEDKLSKRPEIQSLQLKYKAFPEQALLTKHKKIIDLSDKYIARLTDLKVKLTKQNKIDEALKVNEEIKSVNDSSEVSAANFAVADKDAASASQASEKSQSADTGAVAASSALAKKLDTVRIPKFSCSVYETASASKMINRLAEAVCYSGIRVRVAGRTAGISRLSLNQTVPQWMDESTSYGRNDGSALEMTDVTGRAVLEEICRRLRVGYRVDEERQEVAILPLTAPDVEWVPAGAAVQKAAVALTNLDQIHVDQFECSGYHLSNPSTLINNFVKAVYSKGVRVRVSADAARINYINYDHGGMPSFSSEYRSSSGSDNTIRQINMNGSSALQVLQVMCSLLKLAYKIDAKSGEVVILDISAPDAQWVPFSQEQFIKDSLSISDSRKNIGKTVIVSGSVAGLMPGAKDLTVKLDNRIRLNLPKTENCIRQYDEIKARFAETNDRNKSITGRKYITSVMAIGRIGNSVGMDAVLDDCIILGINNSYEANSGGSNVLGGQDRQNRLRSLR